MKRIFSLIVLLSLAVMAMGGQFNWDLPITNGRSHGIISSGTPTPPATSSLPLWNTATQAVYLDGIDDGIQATSTIGLPKDNEARTYMLWIKEDNPALTRYCFATGNTGPAQGVAILQNNTTFYLDFNSYNLNFANIGTTSWRHVALTLPASGTMGSFSIYFDGEQVASQASGLRTYAGIMGANGANGIPDTDYSGVAQLNLGSWLSIVGAGPAPDPGKYAEFSAWNKCMTADEVKLYYDKILAGNEAGLKMVWHLNEGTGHFATEYTSGYWGNIWNGVVLAATWVAR